MYAVEGEQVVPVLGNTVVSEKLVGVGTDERILYL